MGHPVRGNPLIMPLIDVEKFYKIMPKKSWILNTLPNGVTH